MFCLQCGKEDEELFKGLCRSCFTARNPLVTLPPEEKFEFCAHCNSIRKADKWHETNLSQEEIIERTINEHSTPDEAAENVNLSMEILNQKGSNLEMQVLARGRVLGEPVERECTLKVKINRTTCPECSKYASGYYEAVLQLRADARQLQAQEIQKADEIIARRLEKLSRKNRMAYLSQRLELKEGVDYYLGSYKAARKISSVLKDQMGGISKESPRLMGRDKSTGRDLYRIWISLRLPHFQKGDFIEYKTQISRLIGFNGHKIILMDLETRKTISLSWREYPHLEKIASIEEVKNTTITSKTPTSIQLLHPESYQPVELDIRPDMEGISIGDQVEVVEIRGKLYILLPQERIEDNSG
jgi:nonsense-mediated mRNA decay protein 3